MSHDLIPFWLDKNAENQKTDRIDKFMAETYFTWGKELTRWEETWDAPNSEDELSVLHRIERKIHESGIKIFRGDKSREKEDREEKRQKFNDRYSRAIND